MPPSSPIDRALRFPLRGLHALLKLGWFVRRPRTFGAHALALTPEGRIIFVKLRYAPGWRLPGGGRGPDEDPRDAVLRELQEEIGMTSHGEVRLACELDETTDFKRDLASLLVVRDVEAIIEAPPNELPSGLSPRMAAWLDALRPHLP